MGVSDNANMNYENLNVVFVASASTYFLCCTNYVNLFTDKKNVTTNNSYGEYSDSYVPNAWGGRQREGWRLAGLLAGGWVAGWSVGWLAKRLPARFADWLASERYCWLLGCMAASTI